MKNKKDLKSFLQLKLYYIDSKIKNGYNNPEILMQNIDLILNIAVDQKYRLVVPKNIENYINNHIEPNEVDQNYIDFYHKYKEFNIKITDLLSDFSTCDIEILKPKYKEKIKLDNAVNIVGNFFEQYDKDIYKYYCDFIKNGNYFILKRLFEHNGISSLADELMDPYIIMIDKKNIYNIEVLAHEIIHIFLSERDRFISIDEYKRQYLNSVYEVYSHFIELVLLDYLSDINFNKKDIIVYKNEYIVSLIEYILVFKTLLSEKEINFKSLDEILYFDEVKTYTYGKLFSYAFYDNYIADPEKTKEDIKNFMLNAKYDDFEHLINNYGLNEDKILDSRVLINYSKK